MEFISIVNTILGTVPLLILITVIFILLFKENKKEIDRLGISVKGIREDVRQQLEQAEEQSKARDAKQDQIAEKLEARISEIEKNYADKAYVQESVGGWRTEIRELSNRMDKLMMKIVENGNGK